MILNESDIMKEIHAIRESNYENTKHLSPEERSRLRCEAVTPIIKKYNFRIVKVQKACIEKNLFNDLETAGMSSTDFWNNEIDDNVWNDT